jgi:hypothetical protein
MMCDTTMEPSPALQLLIDNAPMNTTNMAIEYLAKVFKYVQFYIILEHYVQYYRWQPMKMLG